MPLPLHPFPRFRHPAFGSVPGELPVTRDGIRHLPPKALPAASRNCFAQLRVRRHRNGQLCRGICGLLPYSAFLDGGVRPHEATLRQRLEQQEQLVTADEGALGKPVLLTVPSLTEWWATQDDQHAPSADHLDFSGKDNAYTLRRYAASAGPAATGSIDLSGLGPLVIADGHHRAETHARLGARGIPGFAQIPVCLIGADELHIGVFARVITAPATDTMFERLLNHFRTEELPGPAAPRGVGEWLLAYRGQYYRLYRHVRQGDATDVDWLNAVVLPDACGITDVRSDGRITFEPVNDPENGTIDYPFAPEALTLVGFPLPKERFFAEVAAGRTLPPKSTRFEPRVPSGLVVWEGGVTANAVP